MGTIRDRGLVKWQSVLIMPEHKALSKKMGEVDYFLNKKPVLDEYQVEEIENNIHYAMEYHLPIRFTLHNEGNNDSSWDSFINFFILDFIYIITIKHSQGDYTW
ncbi:YolD-like family protein [Peribacillus sp. NPDC096448]|uniref:YolD-like family protein n=1 Tax=Peribacillus sp. NPDC096448 TaxID=3364395 RepID=UPI0037FB1C06